MEKGKRKIDRRTFLKATGLGGASMALSSGFAGRAISAEDPEDDSIKEMPTRILGKTGVPVSILGMGGSIDPSAYQLLLRVGLNSGINYWDSANSYNNGASEESIGQFYNKYPEERKNVFQVTKASRTSDPKEMSKQLNLSLERMKTDYIDLYFIHMLQDPALLTSEIKEWAEQRKKEGKIRFFGFSSHANMASMLTKAVTLGWIDAVMISYNYQLMNDDDMKRAVDACTKANIGLAAMKTQGQRFGGPTRNMAQQQGRQGSPAGVDSPPQDLERALQGPPPGMSDQGESEDQEELSVVSHFMEKGYTTEQARLKAVWEDERIATIVSEMTNITILKDNIAAATDSVKLTGKDMEMLDRLALSSRGFYCKGCMLCEPVMGQDSAIPDTLRYMMYYNSYGKKDDARRLFRELPGHIRDGLPLRDYSFAESACPNGIRIGEAMREAVRILG